ncbi:lytic transglycosylase domain-containing protein [uncultured Thiodictyon sp.]|uniref:lytic transglycosylase domain-containing protein n=1 Tax=uncultured Thiodictyon sp. TaxID=1846217 RepID=UPI0025D5759E|nr:lytic transglycosylase domain-containing protein [uncultured Thiodictyon sp.]
MNPVAIRPLWLLVLLPLVCPAAPAEKAAKAQATAQPVAAPPTDLPAAPARAPLPSPPSGPKPSREQVRAMIDEVAKQYGVERELVRAVVGAESNFNAHAVSRVGAVGLMQVMPATAGDYGVTSTAALFDPKTNLRTGTRHLKRLLDKYKGDYGRVIMAYNAGEGVVDRTNSNVTYQETLDYTEAVIGNYRRGGGAAPTAGALTKVRLLRGMRNRGQARRLLKKYLDPSLLSLKVKPTLALYSLSPALHAVGPESRPMFELDQRSMR